MQKKPWSISAKAGGAIEILLYEQIGQDFWSGDGTTAKQFAQDLKAAGSVSQIHLRINSPGGDVFDGLAIYNTLLNHGAKITANVDGLCASIASVIAMAASELSMSENALLMIHNPYSLVMGDSNQMRKLAETMDKIKNSSILAYQRHTKMSEEEISELMDEETWMSASEAIANGFAEKTSEQLPIAASFDLSKFKHTPEQLLKKLTAKKANAGVSEVEATAARAAIALNAKTSIQASVTAKADTKEKKTMITEEKESSGVEVVGSAFDAAEIHKLGKTFNVDVEQFLKEKTPTLQAKEVICNIVMARAQEQKLTSGFADQTVRQLSDKEKSDYSIVRVIRALAGESGVQASLERQVSEDIGKRIGKSTGGMFIPTRIHSGLDTKTGAAGGYSVATQIQDLIELLRNKARVVQLGATVLSGLSSSIAFPVQSAATTGSWVSQNPGSDVADSDATLGQKTMTPKTYQASTAYSRQLLAQSTIDIEAFVRNDLATAHALAIDLAAINGPGTSNQPLGILNTSGIGSVAIGTDGGAPVLATAVDLETAVADANADESGMKYLTTPIMRGKLRKTLQFSAAGALPIWQQLGDTAGVGDVLGYPGYVSKQVPAALTKGSSTDCHAILFGYWPSVMIGEWGVIELIVDPLRLKKQGMIEVTSFQMIDVLLRQPAQMAACKDARNV